MSIMERNSTIDIMKGLAIILMLFIHAPFVDLGITLSFVVPVFFMVSGVFLPSCETCTDLRIFILKKIKSLYIPYVIVNLIFLAFHNFFVRINFYTDSQDFLAAFPGANLYSGYTIVQFMKRLVLVLTTAGGTQLGGATWFLRSLFFSSILYEIMNYAFAKLNVNKLLFHWIFGFVFLIVSCCFSRIEILVFEKNIFLWVNQVLSPYILFCLGKLLINLFNGIKHNWIYLLTVVAGLIVLVIINHVNINFNLAFGKLDQIHFFLLSSLSGFVFMYSVSYFIDKCSVSSFFVLVGKYTIYVLCLHLLFYKFVTLFFVKLHSLPDIYIAAYPTILSLCNRNECFAYGCSYILTGLLFPLLVGLGVRRFNKGRKLN